jgi:hypothetical protein
MSMLVRWGDQSVSGVMVRDWRGGVWTVKGAVARRAVRARPMKPVWPVTRMLVWGMVLLARRSQAESLGHVGPQAESLCHVGPQAGSLGHVGWHRLAVGAWARLPGLFRAGICVVDL